MAIASTPARRSTVYSDGVRSTTLGSSLLLAGGALPGRSASTRVETTRGYAVVATAGVQVRAYEKLWLGHAGGCRSAEPGRSRRAATR